MIKLRFVEWIPAVFLVFAFIALISLCTSYGDKNPIEVDLVDPSVTPPPIRLLEIGLLEKEVIVGGSATLINGICNDTEKPILVEIYLVAQKRAPDPALSSEVVALIEREPGTGIGRGRALGIDPGCHYQEPIPGSIPTSFTPGEWRLFLEATVRDSNLAVDYNTTEFSEYFRVVAP